MNPDTWHLQPSYKRKYLKTFCMLVSGIVLTLLLVLLPDFPTHAADGVGSITLSPDEGEIGDMVEIDGHSFDADEVVRIYFSSDKADRGDDIDDEVTAYEYIGVVLINTDGDFHEFKFFEVPEELNDGEDKEDVHGDEYYVYATYYDSERISAVATFTVLNGEIELDPEESTVGAEVKISGEGLRNNQILTIRYDGDKVDIVNGDTTTDSDGQFTCTFIVPESTVGNHTITVKDESGNKPEALLSVKPKINIDPASQAINKAVEVSGAGFGERELITITFEGDKVPTTPVSIYANRYGSFTGSFIIPFYPAYADDGTATVEAGDSSFNEAEAKFTVLTAQASINLSPTTSQTSPGHAGMELTINGMGFIASTTVTITYSNRETITVATATTNANGIFSVTFNAPPSVAGSHAINSTDGTNIATSVFTMESEAPLMPVPLLPKVAATAEANIYFDWEDVADPSGITYVLQIGADGDFVTVLLEKKGLTSSEYTLTEQERLESTEKETPYYWRVKAVDGASNESEWTTGRSFHVDFSWASIPAWVIYMGAGLVGLLLTILGFWDLNQLVALSPVPLTLHKIQHLPPLWPPSFLSP